MEEKILKEVRQIKKLLSEIIGTSDLPTSQKFSKEAIAKASMEYKKLAIERGEWLSTSDIDKVIKDAPWYAGKIIIEKFEFKNYFKRGRALYFNRKDLIALNKELKKKNINLNKYIELLEDQEKFRKYIDSIDLGKGKKKRIRYKIPESLQDINSKPYSPPDEQIVRDEINNLMEEYQKFNLSEYIDLYYNKTYAMFKYIYSWDRYLDPKLKKYCKDWTFKFNYANEALKMILKLEMKQINNDFVVN